MNFIGWVQYNHDSMPPNGIQRKRYYQLFDNNGNYIIIGDGKIQLKFKRKLIEEIFIPSNGYNSWDEVFKPKESKKLIKNKEDKILKED